MRERRRREKVGGQRERAREERERGKEVNMRANRRRRKEMALKVSDAVCGKRICDFLSASA